MSPGERSALEGLLAMLRPKLAIEIGRAGGGSLRRIGSHAEQVISFDLVQDAPDAEQLENVTLMVGDSHEQLPATLAELAAEGRNVDFVLVDGDHSTDGVKADMIDLLESSALRQTVIVAHDGLNEYVRAGLDAVPYANYEKVRYVDLDFIPGFVASESTPYAGQCWGGFGLVVVDETGAFGDPGGGNPNLIPFPQVVWPWATRFREHMDPSAGSSTQHNDTADPGGTAATGVEAEALAAEVERLRAEREALSVELERHRGYLSSMTGSMSWRITEPLREAKRRLQRR